MILNMPIDYIELDLSSDANLQELKYRQKIQPAQSEYQNPEKWYKRIEDGRLSIIPLLEKEGISFKGKILELGCGSCWCASQLSKLAAVQKIYALDFSRVLLTKVAPRVIKYLNADITKITRVRGDFFDLSYFDEGYFDFVIYDATLHHAQIPQKTLREARRILRKEGRIVCIREPVLPNWTPFREILRKIFGAYEKRYGVIENAHTLDEWKFIFHDVSLSFRPIPYFLPTLKGKMRERLKLLNTLLYPDYCFEGRKTKHA